MDEIKKKAADLISHARRAPAMIATSKEAFMAIVCTALEMAGVHLKLQDFYLVHIKTRGSVYVDLHEEVRGNDEWAHKVCDDALARLEDKSNSK